MRILFVCTGNICRSPFAEEIGRRMSPQHTFASAGTIAKTGNRASDTGILVAHERFDVDLSSHRASELSAQVVDDADIVYGMEPSHLAAVLAINPDSHVELLSPDGSPIPDPYGGDERAYVASYDLIRETLTVRLAGHER